ncbi:MAG: hypothetical protein IKJ35_07135 [Clostridia bacterium]|nr:hypothetical protein [Clostridia bacterium]
MKFSDYYLAPGVRKLSLFYGAALGLLVGFFVGWQIGVLAGAGTALVCSFAIPISAYLQDRPYEKIKQTLARPFLIDERVYFTVKDGTVKGFFILTPESIVLLSLDRGNHRLELSRVDVRCITCEDGVAVSVFLNEKQFVRVISGGSEEICEILRENGWNVNG